MKKIQFWVICTVGLILFGSASPVFDQFIPKQGVLQILVVYPPSQAENEDLSMIAAAKEAINNLKIIHSDKINFTEIFPKTEQEGTQSIGSNAESGFDLIIGIASNEEKTLTYEINYSGALHNILILTPKQPLLLINGLISPPQLGRAQKLNTSRSILYLEHEGSFLVGVLAAMVSNSGKLGFYSSTSTDTTNRYKFGYIQGANFIGDLIDVQYEVISPSLEFEDPYNKTASFIQDGIDVIYGVAGSENLKIFDAISDYNDSRANSPENGVVYAIGSDNDQDFIQPGLILTSMVKRMEVALIDEITKFINGEWQGGEEFYGIEGGHLGISDMMFTQNEKFVEEENFNDQTRSELLQFLETSIINGEIVVSDNTLNAEINFGSENPFIGIEEPKSFIEKNQILIGSLIFALSAAIALFVLREQISRLVRKSAKSKAIDYLDKAKKIAEEPKD